MIDVLTARPFTLACWEGMAYMIVPGPRYLPALARSTVAAGGDSMPPEPAPDEASLGTDA